MNTLAKRNNDVSYDPFLDFYSMEPFFPSFGSNKSFPSVNISEDDKNYCVDVVAPGFKKDDFKINVDNDMLTISAEAKSEYNDNENDSGQNDDKNAKTQNKNQGNNNGDDNQDKKNQSKNKNDHSHDGNGSHKRQYSRREYNYSSFTRSFRLPDNTNDDRISASYKDGILKLMIPKSKQEEKATKEIAVN